MSATSEHAAPARTAPWNDPKIRALVSQAVVVILTVWLVWTVVSNTITNLEHRNIASGFGFLDTTAGFGIIQTLIPYEEASSYGRAFIVGLLNTLLVAFIGIIVATILGFVIGIMRLSRNWLISKIATVYIEVVRNIPLLLQIFVWYHAVLKPLPGPRDSLELFGSVFVNNRGLYMSKPLFGPGSGFILAAFLLGCVASVLVWRWARQRQMDTGEQFPVLWTVLGLVVGLPLVALVATGVPVTFDYPELGGFNFRGGMVVIPEFTAMLVALSIYTAAFMAEIVRAGIQGVSHGQTEAAHSLGLRPGPTLRLVVIPQALRIIIPPLTSQYLNLTKNSSLAVAIAYPDLVAVGGTILNQTGQAVEIIGMWMVIYLAISLATSAFMNWYNARIALVER